MLQEFIAAPEVDVEEEVMSKLEAKCKVRLGKERITVTPLVVCVGY